MLEIPRLFTAVAEWGACVMYISFLKKKFKPLWLIPLLFLWLGIFCGWQTAAGYFPIYLWALGMLGAVVLMVFCFFCCCKTNLKMAIYWGVSAFIVAEFIASFEWQLYYYFYVATAFGNADWFKYLWFALIYALVFALLWTGEKKFFSRYSDRSVTLRNMLAVFFIVLICFVVSNLSFLEENAQWTVKITEKIFEIRTLVDFCGVVLLYTYRVMRDKIQDQAELNAMQNVLESQYRQYCQYKENDEVISRHYHDLKHQIDVILKEPDSGARSKYLEEMQKSLKLRASESKTGNEVLDTVLTGKSQICVNSDINFTVVADGKLLGFMSTMDICSVFGNALDNAIESVNKIQSPERRLIQLALFKQDNLAVLRIRNYYEVPPDYEGNEIVTSKKDKANHGYGLKSIKQITEKYGGSMKIVVKDNWFTLCLLFPL